MKELNIFKTFYCIFLVSIVACRQQVAVQSPPPSTMQAPVPPPPPPPKILDNSPIICQHASCQIEAPKSTEPEFPGGDKALAVYLAKHVKYPDLSREGGLEGTVYLRFVVDKDGTLRNIEVARGVSGGCSEVAVQVVQGMPKWVPATKKGVKVCSRFTLPVKFKLD
jgi:periplasmic protein TonB